MPGTCGRFARRDALSTGFNGSMTVRVSLSPFIVRKRRTLDHDFHAVAKPCSAYGARRWRLGEKARVNLVHVLRFEHAMQQHVHLDDSRHRRARFFENELEVLQDLSSLARRRAANCCTA